MFYEIVHVVQLCNILIFIVTAGMKLYSQLSFPDTIDVNGDDYVDLGPVVRMKVIAERLYAFNIFFNWFMAVPILCYLKVVNLVFLSLRRAFNKVGGFFTVFLALMFGFAQAHCIVFKGSLLTFSTASQSMFTLVTSLLGDFDFSSLRNMDSVMGPILFLMFVVLAIFVFMNMVIAIICDSYEEVSEEIVNLPSYNIAEDMLEFLMEFKIVGVVLRILHFGTSQIADLALDDSQYLIFEIDIPSSANVEKGMSFVHQKRQKYQSGKIIRSRLDNTFDIQYESDGVIETMMHPVFLRISKKTRKKAVPTPGVSQEGHHLYDCSLFVPGDIVEVYRGSSEFESLQEPEATKHRDPKTFQSAPASSWGPPQRLLTPGDRGSFGGDSGGWNARKSHNSKALVKTKTKPRPDYHLDLMISKIMPEMRHITGYKLECGDVIIQIDDVPLVEVTSDIGKKLVSQHIGRSMTWTVRRDKKKEGKHHTAGGKALRKGIAIKIASIRFHSKRPVIPEHLLDEDTVGPERIRKALAMKNKGLAEKPRTKHSTEDKLGDVVDSMSKVQKQIQVLTDFMERQVDSTEKKEDLEEQSEEQDQRQYMAGYMAALAAGMQDDEKDLLKKNLLKKMVQLFS